MGRKILSAFALCAAAFSAVAQERVAVPTLEPGLTLPGFLFRPARTERAPAIVGLHGCSGLMRNSGAFAPRERDWAERLAAAGYVVLLPESFRPRGYAQICGDRAKGQTIPFTTRVDDARAARAWLAQQSFVAADRIGLLGWSSGAITALAVNGLADNAGYRASVAFYPGCRVIARDSAWRVQRPLLMLLGAADDWTDPRPCEALAQRRRAAGDPLELAVYPGAHHGFDAPDAPLRLRTGLATTARGGGAAHIGTDSAARADALARVPEFFARTLR